MNYPDFYPVTQLFFFAAYPGFPGYPYPMPDTGIIQNAFTFSPLDGINVLMLAKHWRGQQGPGSRGQVHGRRREDRRSKR